MAWTWKRCRVLRRVDLGLGGSLFQIFFLNYSVASKHVWNHRRSILGSKHDRSMAKDKISDELLRSLSKDELYHLGIRAMNLWQEKVSESVPEAPLATRSSSTRTDSPTDSLSGTLLCI